MKKTTRKSESKPAQPAWATGLRDYQVTGAQWLTEMPWGTRAKLLADGLGLGKSFEALGAHRARMAQGLVENPCHLVFTTAVSAHDWRRSAEKFWPDMKVHILGTEPKYQRVNESDEDFEARTHGVWKKMLRGESGPCLVVGDYAWAERVLEYMETNGVLLDSMSVDEAHLLKSSKTVRAQLIRSCIARCKQTTLLTGTPIHNRPQDLYNIVSLCTDKFGSYWSFVKRYFRMDENQFGAAVKELLDKESLVRDIAPWVMGREAREVMGEMPTRSRVLKLVEAPDVARISPAKIHHLKAGAGLDAALRDAVKYKLNAAVELVEELGKPVVLYCYRRQDAEALAKLLKKVKISSTLATGDVTAAKRAELIENWKAGATQCLVCTMDAVRESATLTRADVMVFLDFSWLPGTVLQCEGRIDPARQPEDERRPVMYIYLAVRGGPDEVVAESLVEKIGAASGIGVKNTEADKLGDFLSPLDKRAKVLESLSPDDLLRDLASRLDARAARFADLGML